MPASPKQLMDTWFERVWNQCDDTALSELMEPDCLIEGLGISEPGPEAFAAFQKTVLKTISPLRIEVVEACEEDDAVAGHARIIGTHIATGKPVNYLFSFMVTVKNGKAVKGLNVVDYATMLTQIGAMDDETVAKAFAPPAS